MKVLFISQLLFQNGSGAQTCTWSHLECLLKVCNEVSVVAIYRDDEIEENKRKFVGCKEVFGVKAFDKKIENWINILSLDGWCMGRNVRKFIMELLKEKYYDVVFFDDSVMGKMNRLIKKKYPNIKIITFYHDIKAYLALQWMKNGGIHSVPFNLGIMYNERIATKYSDILLVLNERDNTLLEKKYHINANLLLPICVKDGVKSEELKNMAEKNVSSNEAVISFVGAYYFPNVIGICWFVDNVYEKLGPGFRLRIIGKGMEKLEGEAKLPPKVEVVGWVDSLDDEYMKADIIIAPIFEGGGMKVKTAEALKFGKAFIGTSEALEGYRENIPQKLLGNKIFECNDCAQFIAAIKKIAASKEIGKYNEDIRKIFLEHYSYSKMQRTFGELLLG